MFAPGHSKVRGNTLTKGEVRMRSKLVLGITAAVFSLATAATSAHALSLSPGGEIGGLTFTNSNCNAECVSGLLGITVTEVYKMNVDDATDTGSFAGSYTTTFQNTATDPSGFEITYDGGSSISCPSCYLLVKDGRHEPYQYLFDISTWNGTDTITGTNFWPNGGAISHVAIYQTPGGSVPEPTSMLLLGAGLAGVSLLRRKTASA